jgi:alginate O-acetyltransferase complex protein AlgI
MVFSSIDFLFLFLPLFLLAQALLPWRNLTFVLFSLAFYFVGEGWYTGVIVASTLANYGFGLGIGAAARTGRRRVLLAAGVAFNLALLVFFKYTAFLVHGLPGVGADSWLLRIHLPLGISFFSFHAISYLVDIYRRDAQAERSLVNLSLYMLMFPQLIAGPILRFHTVARQLRRRVVDARHLYFGVVLFCFGLGQKVLLADTLAGVADPLFARSESLSTQTAWLATLCYTLQIYFDFGGYSNMALGLGWICGFHFPRNFNYPYVSRSVTEFWRRWHMSLSRWFRDYLYLPLGGNREGAAKTYRNLLIVFLLCGLWHGAAWTFVLWGAWHGLLLVLERVGLARGLARLPRLLQHAYALLAVMLGWVLFRANGVSEAGRILVQLAGAGSATDMSAWDLLTGEEAFVLGAAALLALPLVPALLSRWVALPLMAGHGPVHAARAAAAAAADDGIDMRRATRRAWAQPLPPYRYVLGLLLALVLLLLSVLKIMTGAYSPFIYFRF